MTREAYSALRKLSQATKEYLASPREPNAPETLRKKFADTFGKHPDLERMAQVLYGSGLSNIAAPPRPDGDGSGRSCPRG